MHTYILPPSRVRTPRESPSEFGCAPCPALRGWNRDVLLLFFSSFFSLSFSLASQPGLGGGGRVPPGPPPPPPRGSHIWPAGPGARPPPRRPPRHLRRPAPASAAPPRPRHCSSAAAATPAPPPRRIARRGRARPARRAHAAPAWAAGPGTGLPPEAQLASMNGCCATSNRGTCGRGAAARGVSVVGVSCAGSRRREGGGAVLSKAAGSCTQPS